MPKIEKPPYSVRRVLTNANSKYAKEKWQLLGRAKIFGRRIREYRATKKTAEELRAHGQLATPISDLERADAVKAIEMLRGVTDLVTAAEFFIKYGPQKTDITIREAPFLAAMGSGR